MSRFPWLSSAGRKIPRGKNLGQLPLPHLVLLSLHRRQPRSSSCLRTSTAVRAARSRSSCRCSSSSSDHLCLLRASRVQRCRRLHPTPQPLQAGRGSGEMRGTYCFTCETGTKSTGKKIRAEFTRRQHQQKNTAKVASRTDSDHHTDTPNDATQNEERTASEVKWAQNPTAT